MLDSKKCEKMLVSNDVFTDEKYERFVVEIRNDGSCFAVNSYHERCFLKCGDTGELVKWDHCEPIPAKKKRMMTNMEIFKLRSVFKHKSTGGLFSYWASSINPANYLHCPVDEYTGTDADVWHELEVEE